MPFEIPFALKVLLGIFLFQLALLWMALPFAIYGIKKRMQLAKEQRDEFLQEMFWLRKTVETIPGASGVARRQSQKFMRQLAEKQKAAAEDEDEDSEDSGKKKPAAAPANVKLSEKSAGKSPAAAKAGPAKKIAKKIAAKKPAEVNRDNEPQITVPRPAASLLEDNNYEGAEEEEPEEYGDEDEDEVPVIKPAVKKKAVKKPVAEVEHDDTDDIEDDSLDYLDDDSDPSHLLIDMPLKSSAKAKAQAMTNMVVEISQQDEISEDDEGFFVYRGEKYEHLLDAMKQQQDDAKKAKAS